DGWRVTRRCEVGRAIIAGRRALARDEVEVAVAVVDGDPAFVHGDHRARRRGELDAKARAVYGDVARRRRDDEWPTGLDAIEHIAGILANARRAGLDLPRDLGARLDHRDASRAE